MGAVATTDQRRPRRHLVDRLPCSRRWAAAGCSRWAGVPWLACGLLTVAGAAGLLALAPAIRRRSQAARAAV